MDIEFSKLTDREILILIMSEQKNIKDELKDLKITIELKADAKRLDDVENDVKFLNKMVWVATGAVSIASWVASKVL